MTAFHSNDDECDWSSLVKSSEAYKLAAKQGQDEVVDCSEEPWWQRVFEMSWKGIYRHARNAGLSEVEARETVEKILMATVRWMAESHDTMSGSNFKRQLLYFTRQHIARKVQPKENPSPHDVSVAWGDKHRAA